MSPRVVDGLVSRRSTFGSAKLTAPGRELAGYLRGRASLNRLIDGSELEDLKASQESVTRTRAALTHSNVLSSAGDLNVQAYAANSVAQQLVNLLYPGLAEPGKYPELEELEALIPTDEINKLAGDDITRYLRLGFDMISASCSHYAGAATCDNFKRVGLAIHGPRLQERQTVMGMGSRHPFSHTWIHVHDADPERQDIVQDAWAKGPVGLAEDSRMASAEIAITQNGLALNQAESEIMARGVDKLLTALRENANIGDWFLKSHAYQQDYFNALIADPERGMGELTSLSTPMQTLSTKFAKDVQSAEQELGKMEQAPLMREIRSSGVGRAVGLDLRSSTLEKNIEKVESAMAKRVEAIIGKSENFSEESVRRLWES